MRKSIAKLSSSSSSFYSQLFFYFSIPGTKSFLVLHPLYYFTDAECFFQIS